MEPVPGKEYPVVLGDTMAPAAKRSKTDKKIFTLKCAGTFVLMVPLLAVLMWHECMGKV
jgi:hypothetical protein